MKYMVLAIKHFSIEMKRFCCLYNCFLIGLITRYVQGAHAGIIRSYNVVFSILHL